MNPIICALDTQDLNKAISLANALRDKVAMVKLGLEFCVGAAIGAASIMYCTKCKQQDTHIANAQINQVISNNLALVE